MSASKTAARKNNSAWMFIFICILVIATAALITFTVMNAKKSCAESFSEAFNVTKQKTYDQYRQKAFDYYEQKNHVSNRAALTVGNIKEENALEVLSVSDSWVKISEPDQNDDNTTRWVEFHATGVYTVDMRQSEFIIDDYHNFILVKLKTPQLSHIALDNDTEVYLYQYEKGFLKWNGDYDSGVKMMLNDRDEALNQLKEQLESNDANLEKAKTSAKSLIRSFIRNVNPTMDLKDQDIQIEFT